MEDINLKPLGRLGRTGRCGKSERTKVYFFFPEPLTGLTNGGNDYGYSQWHYQEDDRFGWLICNWAGLDAFFLNICIKRVSIMTIICLVIAVF